MVYHDWCIMIVPLKATISFLCRQKPRPSLDSISNDHSFFCLSASTICLGSLMPNSLPLTGDDLREPGADLIRSSRSSLFPRSYACKAAPNACGVSDPPTGQSGVADSSPRRSAGLGLFGIGKLSAARSSSSTPCGKFGACDRFGDSLFSIL